MSFQKMESDNINRPEGNPCVLIYGFKEEERLGVTQLVTSFEGVTPLFIEEDMLGLTLEQIIDQSDERILMKLGVKPHVVIFNALAEKEVHELIDHIKKNTISKPIFAVVTDTSKKWKFGNLVKELVEEHLMMSKHHKK